MSFVLTVWKNVIENYTDTYPSTEDGYGRAYWKARECAAGFGADLSRFADVWPDLGSLHPVATRIGGGVSISVRYVDEDVVSVSHAQRRLAATRHANPYIESSHVVIQAALLVSDEEKERFDCAHDNGDLLGVKIAAVECTDLMRTDLSPADRLTRLHVTCDTEADLRLALFYIANPESALDEDDEDDE